MKNLLLLITLLFSAQLFAQIKISNNCKADISTLLNDIINNKNILSDEIRKQFPVNTINNVNYLAILVKVNSDFNRDETVEAGILVGAQIKDIVSLQYPLNKLDEIYTIRGVKELQIAGLIQPELHKVVYDTRVDSVHAGYGLPSSYTGKDVLIGITDWGFDYSHPMYYDTLLENSRILAAWDQFRHAEPTPDGFSYGTEFKTPETLIAAGSDTANIYSYHTHGSHVAGITGGSGAGTIFRGVGIESQFLFTTFLVNESAVLDAWAWMYNKSLEEEKRLVINMSWGLYNMGAPDGTSILSEALDAYSDLGVVFVTSGGNNGDVNFHIKKEFETDTLLSRVQFYTGSVFALWGQSIHAWGEEEKQFKSGFKVLNGANILQVETPWYSTATTDTYIDSFLVVPSTTDTIFYNLSMDDAYPSNNRPQMRLRIKKGPPVYRIVLKAEAESGTIHFWNVTELTTDVGNWGMPFLSLGSDYTVGDNLYGVGAPACTKTAISVAAYSASYETGTGIIIGGGPASFSSVGPLITEELKPDISAPGVGVASSISSYTDASYSAITTISFEGREYPFARLSGTSMSAPAVAGIVALIMEANPYLSSWQIKEIIIETAREDDYTGVISADGDTKWGWGKINAYRAVKKALSITGLSENKKEMEWSIYPNPATNQITINNLTQKNVKQIEIFDLSGKLCGSYVNTNSISTQHLKKGTYILRIIKAEKVEQQKFIIQ